MREISFERSQSDLPVFTVINYGDTRTRKTTWAATWPRIIVLGDGIERGYESIITSDRATWFEPDGPDPVILALESSSDLAELFQPGGRIDQEKAKGARTIVFDALSYYCELALNKIISMQGGKGDNRAAYGDLGKHLRAVREMVHLKGMSVIWNCLTAHPNEDDKRGRPLIPGKQGEAWPGAVDFVLRSQVTRQRVIVAYEDEDGKITNVPTMEESAFINTRQNGMYIAGSRLGAKTDMLPDPFTGTYADFVTCLGYDVEALREAVKKPPTHARTTVPLKMTSKTPQPVPVQRSAPKVTAASPQATPKPR